MIDGEIDLYISLATSIILTLSIIYLLYKNYNDKKHNESYINKKR
jgi:hypothetical protein